MMDRQQCEATLIAQLEWTRHTMNSLCRRHGLNDTDGEDFVSWGVTRLVEDDYAILRRFRGESGIRTYLVVVIARLFLDYRVRVWGRWRPTAAARRVGPIGVELERLVWRDRRPLREAVAIVRLKRVTTHSDLELSRLAAMLAARRPTPLADTDATGAFELSAQGADDLVNEAETSAERRLVEGALARAIARLSSDDQALIQLRFWSAMRVADIARELDVPQKLLYRRICRALSALRQELEASGITRHQVVRLAGEDAA